MQPSVSVSVARVQAWLAATDRSGAEIAAEAGVDEKTIRLAKQPEWNPRADTLGKLEALVPADFVAAPKRKRAA